MTDDPDPRSALAVGGVGLLVLLATAAEWVWRAAVGPAASPTIVAVQLVVNVAPGLGLVAAGGWLRRSDLSPARYSRVLGWCVGGLAVSVVLNLLLMVAFAPGGLLVVGGWLRTASAFGAAAGVVVGVVEARTVERSIAAARERERADRAERERERLEYLNSVLRHEVLNAVNVIDGLANHAAEQPAVDPETRDHLETVGRQTDRIAGVVTDVRVLIQATKAENMVEPVDLASVLAEEVSVLRDRHDVDVDLDVPDRATVLADPLVGRVFGELLTNAVEHNDSDAPRVSVRAERTPDSVVVEVADDGPGIPPDERDVVFAQEAVRRHGLGLYLVRSLVRRYRGRVDLAETGPTGSVFRVELPRPTDDASEPADLSVDPEDHPIADVADGAGGGETPIQQSRREPGP